MHRAGRIRHSTSTGPKAATCGAIWNGCATPTEFRFAGLHSFRATGSLRRASHAGICEDSSKASSSESSTMRILLLQLSIFCTWVKGKSLSAPDTGARARAGPVHPYRRERGGDFRVNCNLPAHQGWPAGLIGWQRPQTGGAVRANWPRLPPGSGMSRFYRKECNNWNDWPNSNDTGLWF